METGPSGEDELYKINLVPSELVLKLRKEIQGFRVGLNLEFYNKPSNDYEAKLVVKPLSCDRNWKFVYEPLSHEVRVLSKKIPVTKFLNLQVLLESRLRSSRNYWSCGYRGIVVQYEFRTLGSIA